MTITVPISELKQRTGKILGQAVGDRQDIIVERYGEAYAVILSRDRYQELMDAAQARIRDRFMEAQTSVYATTADIPEEEITELVASTLKESRLERAQNASHRT